MKTYKQFNEGLKDYSNQGKNVRVPGEDTASFGKLFKGFHYPTIVSNQS